MSKQYRLKKELPKPTCYEKGSIWTEEEVLAYMPTAHPFVFEPIEDTPEEKECPSCNKAARDILKHGFTGSNDYRDTEDKPGEISEMKYPSGVINGRCDNDWDMYLADKMDLIIKEVNRLNKLIKKKG